MAASGRTFALIVSAHHEIGAMLGVTKQAAQRKYANKTVAGLSAP